MGETYHSSANPVLLWTLWKGEVLSGGTALIQLREAIFSQLN
jgi:hypothetical protein